MKHGQGMIQTLVLCMTALIVSLGAARADKDCHTKSQCKCQFDDGGVVDLTSLGNTGNTPRFKDVLAEAEGNYYSYNPCYPFTEGKCSSAAACILNNDRTQQVQIGDASKAAFKYDPDYKHVTVSYSSGSLTAVKISVIVLVCDPGAREPIFKADGQGKAGQFKMTLTHVCACPGGCTASGHGDSGGLSAGSIMCILFFSIIILYVVAGTVFLKFVKKKEGTDIVPNKSLWTAIPGFIKTMQTGCFFTFGKCFVRFRKTTYSEI